MTEIFHEICQTLLNGHELTVASIVSDRGSTPRRSGSKMIVYPNGDISGTIGGGAVEGDVIQRALHLFKTGGAEMVPYDLSQNGHAEQMDLICGGRIKVLIEHLAATEKNINLFGAVHEELKMPRPFWWIGKITGDSGQLKVEHALEISPDEFRGSVQVHDEFQTLMEPDRRISNGSRFIEFERNAFLIEFIRPPQTLFLFGAGHVSEEIGILSQRVGFRTIVFDDRKEFANTERFPDADAIRVCPGFAEVFKGFNPRPDDVIVIVTRGHRFDQEVLAQALQTEAGYIGMIGSRRKRDAIYKALTGRGVNQSALRKVHCPIGLSIEAETPAEIAVSVVAQLIQHRAYRQNHEDHKSLKLQKPEGK